MGVGWGERKLCANEKKALTKEELKQSNTKKRLLQFISETEGRKYLCGDKKKEKKA